MPYCKYIYVYTDYPNIRLKNILNNFNQNTCFTYIPYIPLTQRLQTLTKNDMKTPQMAHFICVVLGITHYVVYYMNNEPSSYITGSIFFATSFIIGAMNANFKKSNETTI